MPFALEYYNIMRIKMCFMMKIINGEGMIGDGVFMQWSKRLKWRLRICVKRRWRPWLMEMSWWKRKSWGKVKNRKEGKKWRRDKKKGMKNKWENLFIACTSPCWGICLPPQSENVKTPLSCGGYFQHHISNTILSKGWVIYGQPPRTCKE